MSSLRLGTLILFLMGVVMLVLSSLGSFPLAANNPFIFIGCALTVTALILIVFGLTTKSRPNSVVARIGGG